MIRNAFQRSARVQRARRGVTLTEILVCLALAALLCALIFPVLQGAKNRAQNASSIANLRQLGLAFTRYAVEHNGAVPRRLEEIRLPNGSVQSGMAWHARLYADGYLPDRDILMNPKEKYKTWSAWVADPRVSASAKTNTVSWIPTYGYRLEDWPSGTPNLYRIPQMSSFFILVESWFVGGNFPGYFVSSDPSWRIKFDERGLSNTLFADGHVEAKDRAYFTELTKNGNAKIRFWPQ